MNRHEQDAICDIAGTDRDRLSPPVAKGHAEMITGPVPEQAKRLAQLLREKGFVRR